MAHIENFINYPGGNYIEKSVTLIATQNNTEVHIQPQVVSTRENDVEVEPYAADGLCPVYFNEKAVSNIDFYRTIMDYLSLALLLTVSVRNPVKKMSSLYSAKRSIPTSQTSRSLSPKAARRNSL